MAQKNAGRKWIALLLSLLLLALNTCASAGDMNMLKELPGQWTDSDKIILEGGEEREVDLILSLEKDETMSVSVYRKDGTYVYSSKGTWSFEYVPDLNDHLTLLFTSTDNPQYTGKEFRSECVFEAYTESWIENDTQFTYLILMDVRVGSFSPFADSEGYGDTALHREQGPNMQVVRCNNYVSLRQKASKSARRVAKVPLGALVLAFPEYAEGDFTYCEYHDDYGYILTEYLQPIE